MTGEMSKADVTPEAFPAHFAIADALGGTVHPFDVYQGPYVRARGHRLWITGDGDGGAKVWDETTDKESEEFPESMADTFAPSAAESLIEGGGITPERPEPPPERVIPPTTGPAMHITTPHGDRYRIEPNGNIIRLDMPGFKGSQRWRFLGLVSANTGSMVVPHEDITADWLAAHPLRFKNGNLRYTVRDFDHGTVRVWGNTEHHGVGSIELIEER